MYYGYERMWTLTFLPAGFIIALAASVAFALVYAIGAARGGTAARRFVRVWTWLLLAGLAADLLYAFVSGEFGEFVSAYGVLPLVEMGLLMMLCVGPVWFMAVGYARDKSDDSEQAEVGQDA